MVCEYSLEVLKKMFDKQDESHQFASKKNIMSVNQTAKTERKK